MAEQRRLSELRASGLPNATIAAILGRTVQAVQVRVMKLGLDARIVRWTPAQDRKLAMLRRQGLSVKACAARLNRSVSAVAHRLSRQGAQERADGR